MNQSVYLIGNGIGCNCPKLYCHGLCGETQVLRPTELKRRCTQTHVFFCQVIFFIKILGLGFDLNVEKIIGGSKHLVSSQALTWHVCY